MREQGRAEMKYEVTVVIPTLNAGKYLEKSLAAIRNQNFDQSKIEIIVVDGGSIDNTRDVAQKYGAKILDNPDVLPNSGILIGLKAAQGKYMIRMGADEIYIDPERLNHVISMFSENPDIKLSVVDQLRTPSDRPLSSVYYNYCGDPFTYFSLRRNGLHLIDSLCKTQKFEKNGTVYKIFFEPGDVYPLADGGSIFDLEYLRTEFPQKINTLEFVSSYSYELIAKTGCIGMIKGDTLIHDMYCNFRQLLKKLKFRVVTNVHYIADSGFMTYSQGNERLSRKKYLYPLYCISVIGPVIDAIKISRDTKRCAGVIHFLASYYVFGQIIGQYALKILHKKPKLKAYGT